MHTINNFKNKWLKSDINLKFIGVLKYKNFKKKIKINFNIKMEDLHIYYRYDNV